MHQHACEGMRRVHACDSSPVRLGTRMIRLACQVKGYSLQRQSRAWNSELLSDSCPYMLEWRMSTFYTVRRTSCERIPALAILCPKSCADITGNRILRRTSPSCVLRPSGVSSSPFLNHIESSNLSSLLNDLRFEALASPLQDAFVELHFVDAESVALDDCLELVLRDGQKGVRIHHVGGLLVDQLPAPENCWVPKTDKPDEGAKKR